MKNLICCILIIIFADISVYSQKVSNISYELSNDEIFIFYDLSGSSNKEYWIDLLFSQDDGQTWKRLYQVSGAVGPFIRPGTWKKITWDRVSENIGITGSFKFQIEAEPDVFSRSSSGRFNDKRNGASYKWEQIGQQIWMAENLNIGIPRQNVPQSDNGKIEQYCFNNDYTNCSTYGGLYQWNEMMQYSKTHPSQGICPNHWHLPSESDWASLILYLGGPQEAYCKMRALGTKHWEKYTKCFNDESRLSVLPGGMKNSHSDDTFIGLGNQAFFWSATENDSISAKAIGLSGQVLEVYIFDGLKSDGYSVRCVRD